MIPKQCLIQFFVFVGLIFLSSSEEILCYFEIGFCNWTQDTGDDFDWSRRCTSTPSLGTGPSTGQGGWQCDDYIYIEASNPRVQGDVARLISEPLQNIETYYCLTFWYHMEGVDIGSLRVHIANEEDRIGDMIWSESGEKGSRWHKAEQSFMVTSPETVVVFNAIRGGGYRGDIAIDSIVIASHICPSDRMPTTMITTQEVRLITTSAFTDEEIDSETDATTIGEMIEYDSTDQTIIITELVTEFDLEIVEMLTEELVNTVETDEFITDEMSTELPTEIPTNSLSERMTVKTDSPGIIEAEETEPVVTCTEDQIIVEIRKEEFGDADVTSLHLLDLQCTPTYNNSHVTFKFATTSCRTLSEEKGDDIVYRNLIRSSVMSTGGIVRNEDVSIPITCSFNKKSSVSNEFVPVFDRIAFGASGKGDFHFNMRFYQDETFEREKQDPIIARIGDMMYFGLSVDISDQDVVLYVDNCKAVPTDAPTNWYYVIQDGCMRDSTMQQFSTSSAHRRLFSIEAFMFVSGGAKIVLECDLVLCDERDGISRCPTSCDTDNRKRRETTGDKIIKRSVARTVQLLSPSETDTIKSESTVDWLTPSSIVSTVMFIMASILCIATVIKVKHDQARPELPT